MTIHNLLDSFTQFRVLSLSGPYNEKHSNVEDVYERLAFVDFLEKNVESLLVHLFDRGYIRSLQAYLLLSASDSMGGNIKSVWKRFWNFWNKRSEYIKQKIVLCYYPGQYDNVQEAYSRIVRQKFDNTYRNPFTHESRANFPPLRYETKGDIFQTKGLLKGVAFKRIDGARIVIDLPLTRQEAELIVGQAVEFYFMIEGRDDKPAPISGVEQLVRYNNQFNSFQIGASRTQDYYVHNGLLKIMEMALLEACESQNGIKIDWLKTVGYLI